jgi:periplasmic protein TonB
MKILKNIILLLTLFIATNSFAQEVKNIPPPPPLEKTETKEEVVNKFQRVEVEATFPGGIDAWRKFLQKNLKANTPAKNGAKVGRYTVVVRFVVGKDGKLSDFVIEENAGYGTGEEVVRMLKKSPKWIPGMQNGRTVSSLKRQPVTFLVEYN